MPFDPEYVTLVDSMGDDLRVVDSARVSFAKESVWECVEDTDGIQQERLSDKDTKLINYLASHSHWTPFSQCVVTLRVKMPIFIARQWFKHQVGFTRNETSRRYVDDLPEFWIPDGWRKRADNKKQGSSDEVIQLKDIGFTEGCYDNFIREITNIYNTLIEHDIAPEQARMVLPQAMMTEFIETASLAAYARLCKLRNAPDAQKEIQDYAKRVSEIMEELFPVSWKALMEN